MKPGASPRFDYAFSGHLPIFFLDDALLVYISCHRTATLPVFVPSVADADLGSRRALPPARRSAESMNIELNADMDSVPRVPLYALVNEGSVANEGAFNDAGTLNAVERGGINCRLIAPRLPRCFRKRAAASKRYQWPPTRSGNLPAQALSAYRFARRDSIRTVRGDFVASGKRACTWKIRWHRQLATIHRLNIHRVDFLWKIGKR